MPLWPMKRPAPVQPAASASEPDTVPAIEPALARFVADLAARAWTTPLDAVHDFNKRARDAWVADKAAAVPAGGRVLDVGAGSCPYRPLFSHTRYEAHDFKAYEGYLDESRAEGLYGQIDHVSDVLELPVAPNVYDYALCTEVLEHVPEPIGAVGEMARVLRPGGIMLVTAPLGSGLHQEPYHFYGGYTPHWYRMVAGRFGLSVLEITPNGGFHAHLAQECARVAWTMGQHPGVHTPHEQAVARLVSDLLARYFHSLDARHFDASFTVGYHVALRKDG